MKYDRALKELYARTSGGTRLGLERTIALLEELGNPHRRFPSIHVAGTNGKGSVVAVAAALLSSRGLRVGTYTSPHLVDFRERIVVAGEMIPEPGVAEFVERWIDTCDRWGATFFEATTALAFAHFADSAVDVAVVETGLGGRFDATNVLLPTVAAVTSVGLDHTDLLGDTLEAIAFEKAGIFKPGIPAVIGERDPEVRAELARHAAAAGASAVIYADAPGDVQVGADGTTFAVGGLQLRVSLAGAHQAYNTATALATVRAAGHEIGMDAARASLARVTLPGRYDRRGPYLFDVAHNPGGAAALADTLRAARPRAPVACVFGVLADKDWRQMIREIGPVVDELFVTVPPTAPDDRRWDPSAAAAFAADEGFLAHVASDFDDALARARDAGATVLVTGSFHTVGDAMSRLQISPLET